MLGADRCRVGLVEDGADQGGDPRLGGLGTRVSRLRGSGAVKIQCGVAACPVLRRACDGGEEPRSAGVAGGGRVMVHPSCSSSGRTRAHGVADGAPADLEQFGKDRPGCRVLRRQRMAAQDPFGVGDLLVEDASAGSGLAVPAPPAVAASLGRAACCVASRSISVASCRGSSRSAPGCQDRQPIRPRGTVRLPGSRAALPRW